MCLVLFLMVILNICCIISLILQKIKTIGTIVIIFFVVATIMELLDLTQFIKNTEMNFGKWRCFSLSMCLFYISFCVFAAYYKYTIIICFTVIPAFLHFIHIFFWKKRI